MSAYRKNASANRDALFGGGGGGGDCKKKKSKNNNREELFAAKPAATTKKPAAAKPASSSQGYNYGAKKTTTTTKKNKVLISPETKIAMIKEAEDYRDKAAKCMQRGIFKSPDPVAASSYYKRAADAYQKCGEWRLERFYRLDSAQCNMVQNAYASAASDYTRAAELLQEEEEEGDSIEEKRRLGNEYYEKASQAWLQMNEKTKAAKCRIQAAMAMLWDDDTKTLSKNAMVAIEEAVEAHVPDVLNRYARYRQTGTSAFIDPDSEETVEKASANTKQLALEHMASRAYAHEPLQQELVPLLVSYREFASALYAAGAASAILEADGISTLTLSRSYIVETLLTLAMGDPIAAEEYYFNVHLQSTPYLTTRECKLSEELIRAIKQRDEEALEEARDVTGSNKTAMANLHPSVRELVQELRISGVARKLAPGEAAAPKPKAPPKPERKAAPVPAPPAAPAAAAAPWQDNDDKLFDKEALGFGDVKEGEEGAALDTKALQDEMDALDFGDDEEEMDDDDIDLR